MFITGVGTANPARRFTQKECWEAASSNVAVQRLAPASRAILRRILLGNSGIDTRFLALGSLDEVFVTGPDELHRRFVEHAPELATTAGRRALEESGLEIAAVDALLVSTCTGYLCPGLTGYVSERLGLRPDVFLLDLVGQGCGAALPNLRAAEMLIAGGGASRVLCICVEVCSAAFYLDDDPGVLISACLFGDGAAAAVVSGTRLPGPVSLEWKAFGTLLNPDARDYLRFEQRDGMLRNILNRQVPELAAKHAEIVLAEVCSRMELRREDIAAWIMHPGGRAVLEAIGERLGLTEGDLTWSADVLREYGNLSSPSVLFALKRAVEAGHRAGWWWMSSFGAGFSCHGALLQAQRPSS